MTKDELIKAAKENFNVSLNPKDKLADLEQQFASLESSVEVVEEVEVVKEGVLGTLFLGSSKLPIKKIEEVMNEYGKDGWDVSFQVIEKSRMWLFWEREALIITFVKDI